MSDTVSKLAPLESLSAPIARLFLSGLFIFAGLNKITGYAGTAAYMESQGVPGILLPLVIITEVIGGLMVLVGYQARLAALALAGFSVLSAVFFHWDFADQTQMTMFLKNIGLAGGFLMIFAKGPGAYSFDNR